MYDLIVYPDATQAETACARIVIGQARAKPDSVLGLATGKTMINVYDMLWKHENEGEVSFDKVKTFNLDEYLGVAPENRDSFHSYMRRSFFMRLEKPPAQVHILNGSAPDPEQECRGFESLIRKSGGIDLQLLGLGRNGHIGFNEPGSDFESRTRVIDLSESTRLYYMKNLLELREVPRQALTMGIATILEAKAIVLLVTGSAKAEALSMVINGPLDTMVPGSVLRNHPAVKVIADRAAAQMLTCAGAKVMELRKSHPG